jgi:xylan 1,4-beta-xylosidase
LSGAREDWEARSGRRRGALLGPGRPAAPGGLVAEAGRGQVTLRWRPVPGACGYLVLRGDGPDGELLPVDQGGGDVLAVPDCVYADTTGDRTRPAWYAVSALAVPDGEPGPPSDRVSTAARGAGAASVEVSVDASRPLGPLRRPWHMVGSEHLALLLRGRDDRGVAVGAELAEALAIAHRELGVDRVRAHGVFLDELGVYEEGRLDFSALDRVYDRLLELGPRPVVELGFMPRDMARDPGSVVFDYGAVVSPPRDWSEWGRLVRGLASHLVERYGLDEVAGWGFEVWNEPNLAAFWTGGREDYLRLYEESARALKSVHPRLLVGGPASAAAGWIFDFAVAACRRHLPVDFLSTHTYGNLPLDVAATARAAGLGGVPVWWTEWGVSPRHFAEVNDLAFGAPFVLSGMASALDRVEHLAYWVVSDHFEELGRPPRLFHGGFGLLSVGNLRKPRFQALRMLELLGPQRLPVELAGDGAGSLVRALAAREPAGLVQVLVWNGTLDQSRRRGDPSLDRQVSLRLELPPGRYATTHQRVDAQRSNVVTAWERLDAPDWPDARGWDELRAADHLEEAEPPRVHEARGGALRLELDLPMPAASLLRFRPA